MTFPAEGSDSWSVVVAAPELDQPRLSALLEDRFSRIHRTDSRREAIRLFRKHLPALVILSQGLAGGSCLDPAMEIRKISSDTPLLLIVHDPEPTFLVKAWNIGINAYQVMPLETKKFTSKLDHLLEPLKWQREAEEQRAALFGQAQILARGNAELERFIHATSHDLQEPLQTVTLSLQLLERTLRLNPNPEAAELIQQSMEGSRAISRIMRQLLVLTEVETQGSPMRLISANDIADEARETFLPLILSNKAHLEIRPLPVVRGDYQQLLTVFTHLLKNALTYRREEPLRITLAAELRGYEWEFSVADNGAGIDPKDQGKLFRPMQRLHPRHQYPGHGLGLALCARIIERHYGKVRVESTLGKGSTFFFTLPAVSDSFSAAPNNVHSE